MSDFKWRHFRGELILGCVRWYCKYIISYRELEEMRGGSKSHDYLPLGSTLYAGNGRICIEPLIRNAALIKYETLLF